MGAPTREQKQELAAKHAQELRETIDYAARVHGAPLRAELFELPQGRRWAAESVNRLLSDLGPVEVRAATHEGALSLAKREGLWRPNVFVCCERCGERLRVVDVANAPRILTAHQAAEKCAYRSLVVALVWLGYAPLPSHWLPKRPGGPLEEARAALGVIDGPAMRRAVRWPWGVLPRVCAAIALEIEARDLGARVDSWESVQGVEDLWRPFALHHSESIALDGFRYHNTVDVAQALALRVQAQRTEVHGRSQTRARSRFQASSLRALRRSALARGSRPRSFGRSLSSLTS